MALAHTMLVLYLYWHVCKPCLVESAGWDLTQVLLSWVYTHMCSSKWFDHVLLSCWVETHCCDLGCVPTGGLIMSILLAGKVVGLGDLARNCSDFFCYFWPGEPIF